MHIEELAAITLYFAVLVTIGFVSYRRQLSAADFIIGGRSLNYWLTALAAHASDMSSWLFMGYPALIFSMGIFGVWTAIGLILFMFLNWQFIAPKIRIATEQYNSLTFSSFFESRLADTSGIIRVFTSIMCFVFYTIYISAGLVGLGLLLNSLFQIDYNIGILIGILIVIPYVFSGGYVTLAWIDLFQGIFLMCVILFVPFFILPQVGGFDGALNAIAMKNLTTSLLPNWDSGTILQAFSMMAGWGIGYFGQPHIITKFMGIKMVSEISKSKFIGMSWMTLSLFAATLVGIVGIAFFPQGLADNEQIFIQLVHQTFAPFWIGLILCAVLAATINAMSSQVLVLSSTLAEDLYKRVFHPNASSKELLFVSRIGVALVALIAYLIAFGKISTIYSLVLYAWSGLGASFGPLLIFSLYSKTINRYGAWAGILGGGVVAAIWPYFHAFLPMQIPAIIPAFLISSTLIFSVSKMAAKRA